MSWRKDKKEAKKAAGCKEECGKCKNISLDVTLGESDGVCRRYPPKPMISTAGGRMVSKYPEVYFQDWCGEWQPRK